MLPPAPPTFSITIGCPSDTRIRSAMMRAAVSVDPPGGNGTTSVSERIGQLWACAAPTPARTASASAARYFLMTFLRWSVDFRRAGQCFLQLLQRKRLAACDLEDRRFAAAAKVCGIGQFRGHLERNDDGAMAVGVNEIAGFHHHPRHP